MVFRRDLRVAQCRLARHIQGCGIGIRRDLDTIEEHAPVLFGNGDIVEQDRGDGVIDHRHLHILWRIKSATAVQLICQDAHAPGRGDDIIDGDHHVIALAWDNGAVRQAHRFAAGNHFAFDPLDLGRIEPGELVIEHIARLIAAIGFQIAAEVLDPDLARGGDRRGSDGGADDQVIGIIAGAIHDQTAHVATGVGDDVSNVERDIAPPTRLDRAIIDDLRPRIRKAYAGAGFIV